MCQKRLGFTLVEALVAFTVIGLLVTAGYGVLRTSVQRYRRLQGESASSSGLVIAEKLISIDLRSAYLSSDDRSTGLVGRPTPGAPGSRMDWTQTGRDHSDRPSRIAYFLRCNTQTDRWELWRRFQEDRESYVCGDVERFDLRFFDGERWLDSWGWDVTRQRPFEGLRGLPLAVSLDLTLRPLRGESVSLHSVIPVMTAIINRELHG